MFFKKIKPLILLTFLAITHFLQAQETSNGNWLIYFGNQQIHKRWHWWNEVQHRNYNFIGDLQQLVLRTGIGYDLTENNNNLLLGYGFFNSQVYIPLTGDKTGTHEHRIFQQFITRQNFGRIFIQHRYRMEERILPEDVRIRFRYFLSLNIPVNNPTMQSKTLYLSTYNEIFINPEGPVFDRNRLYGALGYVIRKNLRVEVGYMSQMLENSYRNQAQIVLFNSLPLKNLKSD